MQVARSERGRSGGARHRAERPAAAVDAQSAQPAAAAQATTTDGVEPQVRKIDAPEAEALDLLSVSSGAVAKRAIPVLIVVAAIVAFLVLR